MVNTNLRPDLRITQVFTPVTPVVPGASLPVLLVGVNRHFEFKAATDLTDWNAGSISSNVEFPGWLGGTVETSAATDTVLRPHVYVSGEYGVAEIADVVYDFTADPVFTIQAGADATFSLTTGTAGVYAVNNTSPSIGTFTDANADFIADKVGDGDVIFVNGIATYKVAVGGLESDTQLTVNRVDKGPGSVGATEATKFYLTSEDSNGVRRLISTSDSFQTAGGFTSNGVRVNDLIRLDNWSVKLTGAGVQYSAVGYNAGELAEDGSTLILSTWRRLYFPSTPSTAIWNNSTFTGTVVFVLDFEGNLVPEFYATTANMAGSVAYFKGYAGSTLPANYIDNDGAVYRKRSYTCKMSPNELGLGSFTAEASSVRTFTDAVLSPLSDVLVGSHILIKGTDGIYRPTFYVTDIGDLTNGNLEVTQFSSTTVNTSYGASNVDYAIASPSAGTSFLGATVGQTTAEILLAGGSAPVVDNVYALSGQERRLNAVGEDFSGIDVGDMLFTDAGMLAFVVTHVPSPGCSSPSAIAVRQHEYSALALDGTDTLTNFGYSIRTAGLRSDFKVRRVVNSTELEVVAQTTTPNQVPDGTMVKGAIYFQTPTAAVGGTVTEDGDNPALVIAPDSSASISYEIKKTLSGAALEGDVLISYSEIRNDNTNLLEVTAANVTDTLGDAVPANPLAMAASIALQNTPTAIYVMRVTSDDAAGWAAAFNRSKVDTVYSIVPLTQEAAILAQAQTHVGSESQPENKRERILYQSALFPRSVNRMTLDTEVVTVSRGATQTLTIDRDVTDDGVIVGDVITATAFNGTEEIEFSGRILSISAGGDVLTMLPDGNINNPTTNLTVIALSIDSKTLSDSELRDAVANYASNLQDRRVRNLYPDNITVAFTDTTGAASTEGIYGGGEHTGFATGGFYMCAVEAAKRARYGPVKPLTKTGGAGIETIVDPFKGNTPFQDVIIDAGTYYMEQPNGTGAAVQAIRALSTNSTDLIFVEDSVTTQLDNFARQLRAQIKPLLGPYILDEGFFTLLSAQQGAVVKSILDNKEMKTIKLNNIEEDAVNPDTFRMIYTVEPYFSAARGEITIYI